MLFLECANLAGEKHVHVPLLKLLLQCSPGLIGDYLDVLGLATDQHWNTYAGMFRRKSVAYETKNFTTRKIPIRAQGADHNGMDARGTGGCLDHHTAELDT